MFPSVELVHLELCRISSSPRKPGHGPIWRAWACFFAISPWRSMASVIGRGGGAEPHAMHSNSSTLSSQPASAGSTPLFAECKVVHDDEGTWSAVQREAPLCARRSGSAFWLSGLGQQSDCRHLRPLGCVSARHLAAPYGVAEERPRQRLMDCRGSFVR